MPEVDLPPIERLQAVEVQPGDKIIATLRQRLTPGDVERVHKTLVEKFPDNEVLVIIGLELSVQHPSGQEQAHAGS